MAVPVPGAGAVVSDGAGGAGAGAVVSDGAATAGCEAVGVVGGVPTLPGMAMSMTEAFEAALTGVESLAWLTRMPVVAAVAMPAAERMASSCGRRSVDR